MFFIRFRSNDICGGRAYRPVPPARRGSAPIMIALSLDRQGLARANSGHEFEISLVAFGLKH